MFLALALKCFFMYNVSAGDKMELDLLRLKNNLDKNIPINLTYSFSKELLETTELLELNNVKIIGDLHKDCLDNIVLNIEVSGIMVLPCAVTLKPVNYPFNVKIEGNIEDLVQEIDENTKKIENSIDILPIIWENILMEIPMRVVSDDANISNLKGNGWRVITEETKNDSNSGLAKLKDLL